MSEAFVITRGGEIDHVRSKKKLARLQEDGWKLIGEIKGYNISISWHDMTGEQVMNRLKGKSSIIVGETYDAEELSELIEGCDVEGKHFVFVGSKKIVITTDEGNGVVKVSKILEAKGE